MGFETDFADHIKAAKILPRREYLTKLDYVSDEDIVGAYRFGDTKIPELNDSQRVEGITFKSLDTLTSGDWCDWIVDRLFTGQNARFRPHNTSRDEFRTLFFGRLIIGNGYSRPQVPVGDTFVHKLVEGYIDAIPIFVDETIPLLNLPWGQNHDDARKDLFYMAPSDIGSVVKPLYYHEFSPRATDKQRTRFFPIIEEILTEHLPKLEYWKTE